MNVLPPPLSGQPSHADEGKRIEYVDLAKGFCILLVAFLHVGDLYIPEFYGQPYMRFFNAFRMPLYFFLSGLFFKPYEGFVGFLKRKTNKLIFPFFFFYLLTSVLLSNALLWAGFDVRNADLLGLRSLWAFITPGQFPNGPIWFLLCLFWVNVHFYAVYLVAHRLFTSERWQVTGIVILSVLCGLLGYGCYAAGVDLWAFTDSALSAVPFFCVGYVLRKHTAILQPNGTDKWLPLMVVAAVCITWLFQGGMGWQSNSYDYNPMVVLLGGVAGSLMVMFISKMIGHLPFVSGWGRYSIIILCTHKIYMQLLFRVLDKIGVNEALGTWPSIFFLLAITMFSYEVIIPLCIRLIPWFVAQKDLIKIKG